jgi:ABC-type branched-subunit amino acid transport system permease subunit
MTPTTSPYRVIRIALAVVGFDLVYILVDHMGANYQRLATLSAVYGLLVLSLVVLTGFVGQISFVQAELAGFGGLTAGALIANSDWNFWIALPVAVLASVAVGVVVGLPTLRLQGLILGVVTIALALGFDNYVFTLGPFGDSTFIVRPSLFGWDLADDKATFVFCALCLIGCCWLVANLQRSKTGRILASIRDAEVAARTSGIDVTRYKLLAFGISAGIAGLAGVLLDLTIGVADRQSYGLLLSINFAAVVILMGPDFVGAAIVGGIFVAWGGEALGNLPLLKPEYFNIVLGAGLILQLRLAPDGVVAQMRHTAQQVRTLARS